MAIQLYRVLSLRILKYTMSYLRRFKSTFTRFLCFLNTFVFQSDEGCNFAIQQGLNASRSKILYFRHNDVDHLEQLMVEQDALERKVSVDVFCSSQFQHFF